MNRDFNFMISVLPTTSELSECQLRLLTKTFGTATENCDCQLELLSSGKMKCSFNGCIFI